MAIDGSRFRPALGLRVCRTETCLRDKMKSQLRGGPRRSITPNMQQLLSASLNYVLVGFAAITSASHRREESWCWDGARSDCFKVSHADVARAKGQSYLPAADLPAHGGRSAKKGQAK